MQSRDGSNVCGSSRHTNLSPYYFFFSFHIIYNIKLRRLEKTRMHVLLQLITIPTESGLSVSAVFFFSFISVGGWGRVCLYVFLCVCVSTVSSFSVTYHP